MEISLDYSYRIVNEMLFDSRHLNSKLCSTSARCRPMHIQHYNIRNIVPLGGIVSPREIDIQVSAEPVPMVCRNAA